MLSVLPLALKPRPFMLQVRPLTVSASVYGSWTTCSRTRTLTLSRRASTMRPGLSPVTYSSERLRNVAFAFPVTLLFPFLSVVALHDLYSAKDSFRKPLAAALQDYCEIKPKTPHSWYKSETEPRRLCSFFGLDFAESGQLQPTSRL
eukprot:1929535-Rhodomonas_salina.1